MHLIILVLSLLLVPITPSDAQRIYCPVEEDGIWINPDAKAKEISRIEVDSHCEDEKVRVRVRAFTSCAPRDCKWGWTDAEFNSDGTIQVLLIGFLSSKQITIKAFGDFLDAQVINFLNDLSEPRTEKNYSLKRK